VNIDDKWHEHDLIDMLFLPCRATEPAIEVLQRVYAQVGSAYRGDR
jgi:hypothetical protein